jgi:DnaJ like chaperone protein
MSIWGKILGGAAGLALAGPLGALIGAAAGHFALDSNRDNARAADDEHLSGASTDNTGTGHSARGDADITRKIGFTIGVIALAAKMAKADGVVTRDEIAAFRRLFAFAPGEEQNVARLFNQAKQDVAGFESYANQLSRLLRDSPAVREQVLDCLFEIAKADGSVHTGELAFLSRVGEIFGFAGAEFDRIRETHLGADESDPYRILGVGRDAPTEEIRRRHRVLVREFHPDRLIAEGLPEEAIRVATEKLATINAAWDRVRHDRGI